MKRYKILWVDDEISMLRPHIIFLQNKGYDVETVSNGIDAIDLCHHHSYDLILLDEHMPGLTGLETLEQIKEFCPTLPIVMVTKSEEENIMDMAIGKKIADYLIKPVNPNQILLSLKKLLHGREIVSELTQNEYRQDFSKIDMQLNDHLTVEEWKELYRRLVYWELELQASNSTMSEMLSMQKAEANAAFTKFVKREYPQWIAGLSPQAPDKLRGERPLMSPELFKHTIFPLLDKGEKVFFIVIDNFRYDQWRTLAHDFSGLFNIDEQLYFSILPTATQYARNAIFSGLMPDQIAKMFPHLWIDEEEEDSKNLNEAPLIETQLTRYRRNETFSYHKINDALTAERLISQLPELEKHPLNVAVFNFIDMLSHSRTESKMIRELANNEAAYRSITLSWFRHSPLNELFKVLSARGWTVVLTTDHGSIRVQNAVRVQSTAQDINSNLRYKLSRHISYPSKQVYEVTRPNEIHLPSPNVSSRYIFATGKDFFAYPNNFNHYVNYYTNTFQHGGISMEEMIIPLIVMKK